MRVVLRPPVAHHPAGHTECQTLPFLVPLPPACIPSVALLATRAIRRICVKGKSGLGLFPLFPAFPAPSSGCLRGHIASSHSHNRIRIMVN